MTVLFGHPSGHPASHHAALAYFDAGMLESFCVPWMPSRTTLQSFGRVPFSRSSVQRFGRRHFPPLVDAPMIQGRLGEIQRQLLRGLFGNDLFLANKWLMRTMARECVNPRVKAVHSFEDCSLLQFEKAKRLGKACIYSMPTPYYEMKERAHRALLLEYSDWLPDPRAMAEPDPMAEQKRREMALADLVFAPSRFAAQSIRAFHPDKKIVLAQYGVDSEFWTPSPNRNQGGRIRFIYAGRLAPHKGIPLLLEAWRKANLSDAELDLVGPWLLAESKFKFMPSTVTWRPPCSREVLREYYRQSDVLVFPSYYEGFPNVLLEALGCGLPAICSEAAAGTDVGEEGCGQVVPAGNLDALVESLKWFSQNRDGLPAMRNAARRQAEASSWENYRTTIQKTVRPLV